LKNDIRLYSQNLTRNGGGVRLVATSEGTMAWSIEIYHTTNVTQNKKAIAKKIIKQMKLSTFQDELASSEWNVLPDRYPIGMIDEKQFLNLLASLWSGHLLSDTGISPILEDQKLVAESLIGVCKSLAINITPANNGQLMTWLRSGGVWRKSQGCWF